MSEDKMDEQLMSECVEMLAQLVNRCSAKTVVDSAGGLSVLVPLPLVEKARDLLKTAVAWSDEQNGRIYREVTNAASRDWGRL